MLVGRQTWKWSNLQLCFEQLKTNKPRTTTWMEYFGSAHMRIFVILKARPQIPRRVSVRLELPDGQVNHDITDDVPVYPAFMLCFSAEKSAAKKFGDYCLKVGNPMKLKKRVEAALPEGGVVSVSWRKVEYRKTLKVEADPGADGLARKYWWKPEKYSNEKEWRLLVEFRGNLRLLNKTLKLHIGRPSGNLFRLVSSD